MKLPQLKRPELKLSRPKGPQFQPPQVVSDIYRDLKERHMLPVVALLLVAIVAVPVALSASGGDEAPPVAAPAVDAGEAPEAQPAVLAENPVLRDYRERLEALSSKNPFEQQFAASALGKTQVEDLSVQATPGETAGVTASAGGEEITSGSTSAGSTASTGGEVGGSTDVTVETESKFFTWRVDVHYGVEGDVKEHDNVKIMEMLDPVGFFLGVTEDGGEAVFYISSQVASASGEGECLPNPDDCEFLSLKEGDAHQLQYQAGVEPVTYHLKLEQIKLEPVKKLPNVAKVGQTGSVGE